MTSEKRFELLIKRTERNFSGWDFSYINDSGRIAEEPLTWSYGSIVFSLLKNADAMLDMGTGGGEFLSLLQPFPKTIAATESYPPNVLLAKNRLEPLGVSVCQISDDDHLPFHDGKFDFIINRHESYSVAELRRILSPNGLFLTQQVGGQDYYGISRALGLPANEEFKDWNLKHAVAQLENGGFVILMQKEEFPYQRFYDIGALVYYLKAIPWQAPDFDVKKDWDNLYEIHQLIEKQGYFDVRQHRFLIKARAN
ncbi:class I SAM-dependent methyltransferase [Pseudogracilibacillus auburnensis]|uniref:class I SAM-dependent methyltransferase n=1 Tax=Pseudogracilibacillus auburnensis TaxID=1494959 RepID=UPI001F602BB5|nr:class I SAM-dependent methyltransferase [Pseudogracilibacillus auburnensis]